MTSTDERTRLALGALPTAWVEALALRREGQHITTGLFAPPFGSREGTPRLVLWSGAFANRRAPAVRAPRRRC